MARAEQPVGEGDRQHTEDAGREPARGRPGGGAARPSAPAPRTDGGGPGPPERAAARRREREGRCAGRARTASRPAAPPTRRAGRGVRRRRRGPCPGGAWRGSSGSGGSGGQRAGAAAAGSGQRLREVRGRLGARTVRRRSARHHPAALEADGAVGETGQQRVMGREDDGDARGPCRYDDARDGRPGEPVLADGRLVEDQHRRSVGDRAGQGEPAHLAAGEPVGVGAGQGRQPEDLQQRVGASPGGVLVEPEQAAGAEHVVAHRAGDDRELGLLRHPADPPCQLRGGPLAPARPRRRRRASPPPPPPRSSGPPPRRAGR